MLNHDFKRGIGLLQKWGYTYDILIYPDQLGCIRGILWHAFPEQPFVLNPYRQTAYKGPIYHR